MSADGDTALITVQYDVPVTHRDLYGDAEPLEQAIEPTQEAGVQVVLGGELPSTAGGAMKGTGEIIGIVVALVILLLMFRSVVAAGLPVVVAVAGLAVGAAGITILCGVMSVSPFAPTVATMVGLGVGIDYALLMLVRALEYRRAGFGVVDAAAAANRHRWSLGRPRRHHRAGLAARPAPVRTVDLRAPSGSPPRSPSSPSWSPR